MTGISDGHIFRRFDSEMEHLHSLVVKMGSLALSQLRAAVKTLEKKDTEQARKVIENDKKLNDLDIEADDEIVRIIALRQPMARDLREIIAVSKIIAELERAGDEARKIAGLTIRFYDNDEKTPAASILQDIYSLSEYVDAMLTSVMRAFDDLDLEEALGVLRKGPETGRPTAIHPAPPEHRGFGGFTQYRPFRGHRTRHPRPGAVRRPRKKHRRPHRVYQTRNRRPPRRGGEHLAAVKSGNKG